MKKALWLGIYFAVLIWSAIDPKDYFIWTLEVAPALIGLILLVFTYKKFPLTPLLYRLILIHCIILMVGGHYTYAEVPIFDKLQPFFGFERNHYDRLGHFAQGFVPAVLAREILIRLQVISTAAWRHFIVVCICLAFSAFYELIEWIAAVLTGEAADAFLGSQGDIWDTQIDMAFALIGAISAILLVRKIHDKQLTQLAEST